MDGQCLKKMRLSYCGGGLRTQKVESRCGFMCFRFLWLQILLTTHSQKCGQYFSWFNKNLLKESLIWSAVYFWYEDAAANLCSSHLIWFFGALLASLLHGFLIAAEPITLNKINTFDKSHHFRLANGGFFLIPGFFCHFTGNSAPLTQLYFFNMTGLSHALKNGTELTIRQRITTLFIVKNSLPLRPELHYF